MANVSNVTLKNKTGLGMAKNLKMGTCKIAPNLLQLHVIPQQQNLEKKLLDFTSLGKYNHTLYALEDDNFPPKKLTF